MLLQGELNKFLLVNSRVNFTSYKTSISCSFNAFSVTDGEGDELPGGIKNYLEPGVHYLHYTYENIQEVAREGLSNPQGQVRMGREASRVILAGTGI